MIEMSLLVIGLVIGLLVVSVLLLTWIVRAVLHVQSMQRLHGEEVSELVDMLAPERIDDEDDW